MFTTMANTVKRSGATATSSTSPYNSRRLYKIVALAGLIVVFTCAYKSVLRIGVDLDGEGVRRRPSGSPGRQGMSSSTSMTWMTAVYFSVNNSITMGYGDIVPVTTRARALVVLQMLSVIVLVLA